MSNAFGIIASNIFQQIARQLIKVTNAQEVNRIHGSVMPFSWSGEWKAGDLRK